MQYTPAALTAVVYVAMKATGDIDFGIGTLRGVWHSEDTGDYIISISFHAMTFEDVVLLLMCFMPLWSLVTHLLFVSLPEWWGSLGEKAELDDRAESFARQAFERTAIDMEEAEALEAGDSAGSADDEDAKADRAELYASAGAPPKQQQQQQKRVDFGHLAPLCNGHAGGNEQGPAADGPRRQTRPSRPTGGLPNAASLPAPTCRSWFISLLPLQLRPRAVYARASSVWGRARAAPADAIWGMFVGFLYTCLCFACCGAPRRRAPSPRATRPAHGRASDCPRLACADWRSQRPSSAASCPLAGSEGCRRLRRKVGAGRTRRSARRSTTLWKAERGYYHRRPTPASLVAGLSARVRRVESARAAWHACACEHLHA